VPRVTIYEKLGKRIQELRRQRDLTQAELAEAADMGLSYLVKIEGGTRQARLDVIERIAIALDEPMWRLFSDSRLTTDEKRTAGETAKLTELAMALAPADVRALLAVAQRLSVK